MQNVVPQYTFNCIIIIQDPYGGYPMINNFHFACPGEIFFGPDCIREHPEVFSRCGKKAFIVSCTFESGDPNVPLMEVCALLDKLHIAYAVNTNTIPDPPVESAVEILEHLKAFGPDFLISVGGGSTLDTAKAINILLKYPGADPYDILFGKGPHVFGVGGPSEGALPYISIPTTAGTGADIAGVCVMTRADIDNKAASNRRSYADYIFVDPNYIKSAPLKLNHATALDALCHGIEIYLSRNSRDDFMLNMLCETAFKLFADIKDHLLSNEMSDEDYKKQALHSTLQGLVIVNGLTGVPHGMGYPLSHFYEVPHGLACAVFEGEYLRILSDQTRVTNTLHMLGFSDIDAFCDYLQDIISLHVDLQITQDEINRWTRLFCDTKWRVDRHPEDLTEEMVHGIYSRALKKFIID